jgi:hypothetical protein
MNKTCHHCGEEWGEKRLPGFREECGKCGQPLHCCGNCRFYDPRAYEWCREPQARDHRPRDAEQGNSCEYFLFAEVVKEDVSRQHEAREKLATLFGEATSKKADKPPSDWMKTDGGKTQIKFD